MLGPRLLRIAVFLSATLALGTAHAGGWQEAHETSNDVRLTVAPDGSAIVQHHLRYRVVAGHFKTFDVVGLDPRAELVPDAVITPEKGGVEVPARVEPVAKTPGTVRISIDEGKGLTRGAYVVDVKYRLDLVATNMLTRDGALWKLAWTAPPTPEGHDGARVVFELPSAPTEPRLAATAESTTTLATLRRSPERDELELVRTHVPRGEAVTWAARVDPKAFPRVTSPELRPPPPADVRAPSVIGSNVGRVLVAAGFALLAGGLAALLRRKHETVRAAAALRDARVRLLVPLPSSIGPFAYGIVTALALATLLWSTPIGGALLVAVGMALATHRAPALIARPRGPGSWQPLSDPRALVAGAPDPLPTDVFDIATRRARLWFGGAIVVMAALSWGLRPYVPQIAIALPLTFAAIVPIFVTGTRSQLAPTPTELGARLLRPARDALAATIDLAHVELTTIGRVVRPGVVDEIRLVCAPRDRMPGLRTIELALATVPGGFGALPEVFVRFDDGSASADRIARIATGAPVVPGRAAEEKVVRLSPDEPSPSGAAALVAKLVLSLEGRRASDRPGADERGSLSAPASWKGKERRRMLARSGMACGKTATA